LLLKTTAFLKNAWARVAITRAGGVFGRPLFSNRAERAKIAFVSGGEGLKKILRTGARRASALR